MCLNLVLKIRNTSIFVLTSPFSSSAHMDCGDDSLSLHRSEVNRGAEWYFLSHFPSLPPGRRLTSLHMLLMHRLSCVIERAGSWDLGLPFINKRFNILVILTWFLNFWVFYKSNLPIKMCAKWRAYSQSGIWALWE